MPKSIVPLFFSYFSPSAAFQWLAPELVSFFPSMCWIYFAFLFFFCVFFCLFVFFSPMPEEKAPQSNTGAPVLLTLR